MVGGGGKERCDRVEAISSQRKAICAVPSEDIVTVAGGRGAQGQGLAKQLHPVTRLFATPRGSFVGLPGSDTGSLPPASLTTAF